jgi:hypothetical protein
VPRDIRARQGLFKTFLRARLIGLDLSYVWPHTLLFVVYVDGIPPVVSFARSRASQKQLDPSTRLTRTFNLSLQHRLQGANTRRQRVTPMQSIPPSIRGTRGTSTSLEIPLSLLLLTFSLFLFPIMRASPYEISKRSRD